MYRKHQPLEDLKLERKSSKMNTRRLVNICLALLFSCYIDGVGADDGEDRHNFHLIESDQGPHVPFSMNPSTVPTIRLTKSPTKAPTLSPTIAPTKGPTSVPTTIAPTTIAPTISPPTEGSSSAPTDSVPKNQPTIDNCIVSEDGTFGNTLGDKAVMSYKFEIETKQSADTSVVDLLSPVEKGIGNSVLKTVPSVCQNSNGNRNRKLLDSGKLIGFSSNPRDIPTDGEFFYDKSHINISHASYWYRLQNFY